MAGVVVDIHIEGMDRARAALAHLGTVRFATLMDSLGRLVQGQVRRRIAEEKRTPAGRPWPRTKDGRPALYRSGNHLYDSVDYRADPSRLVVGSGWIGAAVHQFGAVIVPRRARALAFVAGGKTVFARRVVIPPRMWLGMSSGPSSSCA